MLVIFIAILIAPLIPLFHFFSQWFKTCWHQQPTAKHQLAYSLFHNQEAFIYLHHHSQSWWDRSEVKCLNFIRNQSEMPKKIILKKKEKLRLVSLYFASWKVSQKLKKLFNLHNRCRYCGYCLAHHKITFTQIDTQTCTNSTLCVDQEVPKVHYGLWWLFGNYG